MNACGLGAVVAASVGKRECRTAKRKRIDAFGDVYLQKIVVCD